MGNGEGDEGGGRSPKNLRMGDDPDFCGFTGNNLGYGLGTTLGILDIDSNDSWHICAPVDNK